MNQVELHPYLKQSELVRFLKDFDILPVAFCPLAKPVAKTETRDPRDGVCPDLREAENIKKIAEKYKKSNLQVVLRWNVQRGACVIPKSKIKEHQKENFDIWDFEISEEEMKVVEEFNCKIRIINNPSCVKNYDIFA